MKWFRKNKQMLDAKSALSLTKSNEKTLRSIIRVITYSAKGGSTYEFLMQDISDDVAEKLRELGYEVTFYERMGGETYTIISWKKGGEV